MINGMPAAITTARVQTDSGLIDASVVAYQWDPRRVYYFVMLTPGGYGMRPFLPMINSLRRITPAEAAAIRPRVIHIETVRPGDTAAVAQRHRWRIAITSSNDFCRLNGLAANGPLRHGRRSSWLFTASRRS